MSSTNGRARRNPHNLAETFSSIRADYDMSRDSRFIRRRTGLAPQGNSADWHYRNESFYYRDIEKARDLDRNDAIVGQTTNRAVDNIVQDGFTLDPQTGDARLDTALYDRFQEEANDPELCDVAEEFCFHDFERHNMRAMLGDGDVVNLGLEGGQLQHLEAHNIQTTTRVENTVLGVTKNEFGKRMKYWVLMDPIDPNRGVKEQASPVDVRNSEGMRTLFHIYNPKRMSQTRGVTAFAPIFSLAGMFDDIQFARLVQQQVVSCFAVFRSYNYIPDLPEINKPPGYGASDIETTSTGETRQLENIAPGMEVVGRPGETISGFSPDVPNTQYFEHVRMMLQMIGVNLGLPLVLVLMDASETNFSGWRGAIDEARKGFRANQRNLMDRFHKPYYRWKVSQWLADDPALRSVASRGDIDIFGHQWNTPRWAYIEPVKEAQGDVLRLQNTLTSPRRLHAERGGEWEEIAAESVEDNAFAIRRAKDEANRINTQYPDDSPVHWRELISLPMPSGIQMNFKDPNEIEAMEGSDEGAEESDAVRP